MNLQDVVISPIDNLSTKPAFRSAALVRPQFLPRLSKRLPHPPRQIEPDQPGKHHHILVKLHTVPDRLLLRPRLELRIPHLLRQVRASQHGPEHDVPDGAGDDGGHGVEALGAVANLGHVAVGGRGEQVGAADVLRNTC